MAVSIGICSCIPIVRQGICSILNMDNHFKIVAEVEHLNSLMNTINTIKPEILVIDDIGIENVIINFTRNLKINSSYIKNIIISSRRDDLYILNCLKSNIKGYILRTSDINTYLFIINKVAAGYNYISSPLSMDKYNDYLPFFSTQNTMLDDNLSTSLSLRENEILELILHGYTNTQIARYFLISVRTVEAHRANIMHKLGVHTKVELAYRVLRQNLITK